MSIKENMLLAEFLGWEVDSFSVVVSRQHSSLLNLERRRVFDLALKFDNDWNWLMLVVEKIETDSRVDEFIIKRCNTFNKYYCEIFFSFKKYRSVYTEGDNKITTVFNACIEAVKELS